MIAFNKMIPRLKSVVFDRLQYFVFFRKYTGRKWYKRWEKEFDIELEELEFQILQKILPQNAVAFDIGANRGEASYYFVKVTHCAKVYAFEPQKRMFTVLSAAVENMPQVIPFRIAFSDKAESKKIFIPIRGATAYSQMASFEATSDKQGVHMVEETVETERLDDFVRDQKIEKIDFIKCDTEGHELSVFRGAEETLQKMRPLVITEIYPHKEAEHKEAVLDLFQQNRYTLFFYKDGMLARNGSSRSHNYIFIPNEKIAELNPYVAND